MVMAGNESMPGTLVEDSLSARLQWLRQRREALQEKLAQKNNELKNLCVEEAELTGVLPPEIPLEPGESPPLFRRRAGTVFTYPQNMINRLKTNEPEESALELERQVQIGIVEAALGIINDPMKSKAVRRKHRLVYQQSQKRLQELEARLSFIRQTRGKAHRSLQTQQTSNYSVEPQVQVNTKHRTKKPRPPLDNTRNDTTAKPTRDITQESGVSLSPLAPEQKCNTYPNHGYEDPVALSSMCNHNHGTYPTAHSTDQRQSMKIVEHDHNDNHNIYILPDQYRTRTYSHGSGNSRNQNHYPDVERVYRVVSNTYGEDDYQMRYRQFQQQPQQPHFHKEMQDTHQQYPDYKHLDSDVQRRSGQAYHDREFHSPRYSCGPDYHMYSKNSQFPSQNQKRERDSVGRNMRYTSTGIESQLPPGYWMRYDGEIVWCTDEQSLPDRFGSLDRRKRNALPYTGSMNVEAQSRYRTVAIGGTTKSSSSTHQHTPVQLLPLMEQVTTSNKMLLRTQSLGSVETWHSNQSHESQDGKDITDNVGRKGREKEWYETSLDSGTSPGLDLALNTHRSLRCQSNSPSSRSKAPVVEVNNENVKENYTSSLGQRCKKETPVEEQRHFQAPSQLRYEQPRHKVLEIPAESKPSPETEEAICIGSPQNCTIVQAGKYQPYREVTKPFEMSDFYKYSTKFRKKNENAGLAPPNDNHVETQSAECAGSSNSSDPYRESNPNLTSNVVASPVQKRIYQPVQRMTCQPYLSSLR